MPVYNVAIVVKRKKLLFPLLAIIFFMGVFLVVKKTNSNFALLKIVGGVAPLQTRHNYSSIKEALQETDYHKYPTIFYSIPIKGSNNSIMFNPKTNTQLELDTSEGGGYACCEAPTFYVWVDRNDNIFWVRNYQASLISVNDKWYGPFALTN